MYIGVLDIEQYDCPVVKLTEKKEGLSTTVLSVNLSELPRGLEQVYLLVKAGDDKLKNVSDYIAGMPWVKSFKVVGRMGDTWRVSMVISKTHTMEASVSVGTLFVAPWIARSGVERWTLGFTSKQQFYDFLSRVRERDHVRRFRLHEVKEEEFVALTENYVPLLGLVSELNKLTYKQLQMLETAVKRGYYSWPKEIDSIELAKLYGVSRVSVIKSLRRAEYKVLKAVVQFMAQAKKDWEKN